ncbi:MAG: hypothetical protein C0404_02365, partial [Verrucomicrobia bacterium]|nr:hypothetical protein [Verrucomicrobiota bacterium]
MKKPALIMAFACACRMVFGADDFPRPFVSTAMERENVFEFTEKPAVRTTGKDIYEITFASKANCDVTAAVVDDQSRVVRHLGSGVLGANAPAPFQKGSLKQKILWNGKDDFGEYVKEPGKMRVRVMLGLKPTFDKLLGDGGPKNLPGYVWGLAIGQDGAYVFSKGQGYGQISLKKFDRDGNYMGTLYPPAATVPLEKLPGMGYVEYEAGKKAVHGRDLYQSIACRGFLSPNGTEGGRRSVQNCQPVLHQGRVYFANPGIVHGVDSSLLHYYNADGTVDAAGLKGSYIFGKKRGEMDNRPHAMPRLAVSPDGKYMYMVDAEGTDTRVASFMVWRKDISAPDSLATEFIGTKGKPGSDNQSFGQPTGIDCDNQGRIYVCDAVNNRVQVFSPEGKHVKTIGVDRPYLVQVHKKNGAIYVLNVGRKEGRSADLITKFESFDKPEVVYQKDQAGYSILGVDCWAPKTRLWLAGGKVSAGYEVHGGGPSVRIFEEDGKELKLVADFDEESKKIGGAGYMGRWGGGGCGGSGLEGKIVCDPTRNLLYYENRIFDIKTGARKGTFRINAGTFDDFDFDKFGRMHVHFNPGFYFPGIGRVDPAQARETKDKDGLTVFSYPEMPYDYGEEKVVTGQGSWKGVLPVRDQPGAKYFQDGLGVNMRGDVIVESNIYWVPKMEDEGFNLAVAGMDANGRREEAHTGDYSYEKFAAVMKEREKKGEEVFSIQRQPGVSLAGATVWTFSSNGELKHRCAATVGNLINGVRIDEDGYMYFVLNRAKAVDGKPFLADRTGRVGETGIQHMMSASLVKAKEKDVKVVSLKSPIQLEQPPNRPADVVTMGFYNAYSKDSLAWIENAEWIYGGISPVVDSSGCTCPTSRFFLDWFKRSFVPEAYRHSIGIVDTSGNLIMHLGRYGNYDSG